jgi:hypothetical protein
MIAGGLLPPVDDRADRKERMARATGRGGCPPPGPRVRHRGRPATTADAATSTVTNRTSPVHKRQFHANTALSGTPGRRTATPPPTGTRAPAHPRRTRGPPKEHLAHSAKNGESRYSARKAQSVHPFGQLDSQGKQHFQPQTRQLRWCRSDQATCSHGFFGVLRHRQEQGRGLLVQEHGTRTSRDSASSAAAGRHHLGRDGPPRPPTRTPTRPSR